MGTVGHGERQGGYRPGDHAGGLAEGVKTFHRRHPVLAPIADSVIGTAIILTGAKAAETAAPQLAKPLDQAITWVADHLPGGQTTDALTEQKGSGAKPVETATEAPTLPKHEVLPITANEVPSYSQLGLTTHVVRFEDLSAAEQQKYSGNQPGDIVSVYYTAEVNGQQVTEARLTSNTVTEIDAKGQEVQQTIYQVYMNPTYISTMVDKENEGRPHYYDWYVADPVAHRGNITAQFGVAPGVSGQEFPTITFTSSTEDSQAPIYNFSGTPNLIAGSPSRLVPGTYNQSFITTSTSVANEFLWHTYATVNKPDPYWNVNPSTGEPYLALGSQIGTVDTTGAVTCEYLNLRQGQSQATLHILTTPSPDGSVSYMPVAASPQQLSQS